MRPASRSVLSRGLGYFDDETCRLEPIANWTRVDVVNSAIVLGLILVAYIYFNG